MEIIPPDERSSLSRPTRHAHALSLRGENEMSLSSCCDSIACLVSLFRAQGRSVSVCMCSMIEEISCFPPDSSSHSRRTLFRFLLLILSHTTGDQSTSTSS